MKKLFFTLVLMLMSASAFSQFNGVRSLRVENHTSCRQYYTVIGGKLCNCINPEQEKYHSDMIVINPGDIHFYPNTTTLGGMFLPPTPPAYIYME